MENRNKKDAQWQGIHIFLAVLALLYTVVTVIMLSKNTSYITLSFMLLSIYIWMLNRSAIAYAKEERGLAFFLSVGGLFLLLFADFFTCLSTLKIG